MIGLVLINKKLNFKEFRHLLTKKALIKTNRNQGSLVENP